MTDIRNPGLNVEDQEKPLDPRTKLGVIKRHRRSMLVNGVDSANLIAIFMSFLFEVGRQFIEHIGRFFMFPLSVFAAVFTTVNAWQDMQIEKRKKGTLERFAVEVASTALITVAVAGSLIATAVASAAFTIVAPVLFTVAMVGKALFSLGSAIYYWWEKKCEEAYLVGRETQLDCIDSILSDLDNLSKQDGIKPDVLAGLDIKSHDVLKEAFEKRYDTVEARKAALQQVIEKEKEACEQQIDDTNKKIEEYSDIVKNNLIGFVAVTLAAVAIGAVMLAGKFVLAVLGVTAGVIGTAFAAVHYKKLGARKTELLNKHDDLAAEEAKANELTLSTRLYKTLVGCCNRAPARKQDVENPSLVPTDAPRSDNFKAVEEVDGLRTSRGVVLPKVDSDSDDEVDSDNGDEVDSDNGDDEDDLLLPKVSRLPLDSSSSRPSFRS